MFGEFDLVAKAVVEGLLVVEEEALVREEITPSNTVRAVIPWARS